MWNTDFLLLKAQVDMLVFLAYVGLLAYVGQRLCDVPILWHLDVVILTYTNIIIWAYSRIIDPIYNVHPFVIFTKCAGLTAKNLINH